MYCHHHLTQVWRNWSLAKWEIISKLAEHFFWLWQNWRLCPAKLLRRFGEIGGCGCWKLSRSYEVAKLLLKQSLGAKLEIISKPAKFLMKLIGQSGDRLSSNPEPDWVWRNWRLSPNSPNFSFEFGEIGDGENWTLFHKLPNFCLGLAYCPHM